MIFILCIICIEMFYILSTLIFLARFIVVLWVSGQPNVEDYFCLNESAGCNQKGIEALSSSFIIDILLLVCMAYSLEI